MPEMRVKPPPNIVCRVRIGNGHVCEHRAAQAPSGQPGKGAEATTTAEAIRLYMQIHLVPSHPRCINCHPRDDTPKQYWQVVTGRGRRNNRDLFTGRLHTVS